MCGGAGALHAYHVCTMCVLEASGADSQPLSYLKLGGGSWESFIGDRIKRNDLWQPTLSVLRLQRYVHAAHGAQRAGGALAHYTVGLLGLEAAPMECGWVKFSSLGFGQ